MKFEAECQEFAKFLRSLEHFFQTVRGQNNFWYRMLFLLVSGGTTFLSFFYFFLGSIIQKVNKTLDVVRDSFTYAEQTSAIFKFLVDQTQTPNSKVKVATMNYLRTLTQLMEPSEVLTMSNLSSGRN